ncbi:Xyloglucan galactosyltransferase [Vigna angularis]|uniref:Xyloglucan galactosyltransferase n=1 Tax=Phaseolus angularis TaxID=3914 RepID=A0A8T0L927_PHAAN|nr:Xyloglucan galactosyltransferase [Vigna angularis]
MLIATHSHQDFFIIAITWDANPFTEIGKSGNNSSLLLNLNPWGSRCNSLSNNGFGLNVVALPGIVPEDLLPAWHWTDQFVTEVIFHNQLLNHRCRVNQIVEPVLIIFHNALFCFADTPRRAFRQDFRAILLSQCRDSGESCRTVNCTGTRCSNDTSTILETFMDSDFCLQPRGDSFARRSIFNCMVAGSILVFFWRRSRTNRSIIVVLDSDQEEKLNRTEEMKT